jgi:uncharacterized protein YgbK (DUF1537 family)
MNGTPHQDLPSGVLVAWYGDDFTGSAAVMEVLSFAGIPSVLFLDIPTPEQIAKFPDVRGFGIAGTARSQTPQWMQQNLPPVFTCLKSLNAPVTHYKVCSTLDSSPDIGSIGRAIDLAQPIFQSNWVPLLLAAPAIRRYQSFGHLFAGASDGVYRLDRHPVMSRHPVTPMAESDVAHHLSRQTDRDIRLLDLEMIAGMRAASPALTSDGAITLIDTISQSDLTRAGRFIWENLGDGIFAAGSQGLEYALVSHWVDSGCIPVVAEPESAGKSDRLIVVSGSVSSVTAAQINWALDNGFAGIALDAVAVVSGRESALAEVERVLAEAALAVSSGIDPIIYSARGPEDPAVQAFSLAVEHSAMPADTANNIVGETLGIVLDRLLRQFSIPRAVISGGDTSGHAARQLEIFALTALAPTVPGAALFQAHSQNPQYNDLQIALKGGQMGTPDYFGWIKQGGGTAGKRRIAA